MAVSDDEAASLVNHIEGAVREEAGAKEKNGLIDIMNQWRADVEAGRQIERKLKVRASPGLDTISSTPRTRSTSSGDFVGKEDYLPTEQLDMLIEALGVAFIAPPMMARRFMAAVEEFGKFDESEAEPAISLIQAGDGANPKPENIKEISSAHIDQSSEATQMLATLLLEISEEASLPVRNFFDPMESR